MEAYELHKIVTIMTAKIESNNRAGTMKTHSLPHTQKKGTLPITHFIIFLQPTLFLSLFSFQHKQWVYLVIVIQCGRKFRRWFYARLTTTNICHSTFLLVKRLRETSFVAEGWPVEEGLFKRVSTREKELKKNVLDLNLTVDKNFFNQ